MENNGIAKFFEKFRLQTLLAYLAFLLLVAFQLREFIATSEYWFLLLASTGSLFIIEKFVSGKTVSLSIYELKPNQGPYHQFLRVFWFILAVAILAVAVIGAISGQISPNT